MKYLLLFLWQLPQNILGLAVVLFTQAFKTKDGRYWVCNYGYFGVSLGRYIVFGGCNGRMLIPEASIKHETGHTKQSLYLGPLYLLIIGLPSITFNIYI